MNNKNYERGDDLREQNSLLVNFRCYQSNKLGGKYDSK